MELEPRSATPLLPTQTSPFSSVSDAGHENGAVVGASIPRHSNRAMFGCGSRRQHPRDPAPRFPPPAHRRCTVRGDRARGQPVENAIRPPPPAPTPEPNIALFNRGDEGYEHDAVGSRVHTGGRFEKGRCSMAEEDAAGPRVARAQGAFSTGRPRVRSPQPTERRWAGGGKRGAGSRPAPDRSRAHGQPRGSHRMAGYA